MCSRRKRWPFAKRHLVVHDRQALEFGRDAAVIPRGGRERFSRQSQARRQAPVAALGELLCQRRIVRGIGHHGHTLEILRRRANHRRPADVDILDQLLDGEVRPRRRGLERIQVHHHQVHRGDAVLLSLFAVFGSSAAKQNAAVHLRVQRFHAAAQHLRPAGQVRDVAYRDAGVAQQLRRASRRNNLHSRARQSLRKFH